MDSSMSTRSALNPRAAWWYPTGTQATIIPDNCIVVNAQALNRFNQVLKPASYEVLSRATKLLEVGIDGNLVLTEQELCNIYADFIKSLPRPFDLSLSLMKASKARQNLYKAICFNSTKPRESEEAMKPRDIVISMRIINSLNDLIKRILLAERSGEFVAQFSDVEHRAIWKTDVTLFDLEHGIIRYLGGLKRAKVTNGTKRPQEFTPWKGNWHST